MRPLLSFALLLTPGLAFSAQELADPDETTPVMLSTFEPASLDSKAFADELPKLVFDELKGRPSLELLRIRGAPSIGGQDPELYMASCPKGEIAGCTYVVSERAGARFAVTGVVDVLATQAHVDVTIIDVKTSREAVNVGINIKGDDTRSFSDAIYRVLVALIESDTGEEFDPRDGIGIDEYQKRKQEEHDNAVRELAEVSSELGDLGADVKGSDRVIERPKLTEADIRQEARSDAVKAWERVGMSPDEYMRYRNSGFNLIEWRKRAVGRSFQVLLRPCLGVLRGPVSERYEGRYLIEDATFDMLEVYSFQSLESGWGFAVGASVGFGILPFLEVEGELGTVMGSYAVNIEQDQENRPQIRPDDDTFSNSSLRFGGGVRFVPFPVSNLRPVLGAGIFGWRGTQVLDHILLPTQELSVFPSPTLWGLRFKVGGEARLSQRLDAYALVPVDLFLSGMSPKVVHQGEYLLEGLSKPETPSPFGLGIEAGIQVRLGGRKMQVKKVEEEDL